MSYLDVSKVDLAPSCSFCPYRNVNYLSFEILHNVRNRCRRVTLRMKCFTLIWFTRYSFFIDFLSFVSECCSGPFCIEYHVLSSIKKWRSMWSICLVVDICRLITEDDSVQILRSFQSWAKYEIYRQSTLCVSSTIRYNIVIQRSCVRSISIRLVLSICSVPSVKYISMITSLSEMSFLHDPCLINKKKHWILLVGFYFTRLPCAQQNILITRHLHKLKKANQFDNLPCQFFDRTQFDVILSLSFDLNQIFTFKYALMDTPAFNFYWYPSVSRQISIYFSNTIYIDVLLGNISFTTRWKTNTFQVLVKSCLSRDVVCRSQENDIWII